MRGTGGDVLYLDFDGVLHPDEVYRFPSPPHIRLLVPGRSLFENLPWLSETLDAFPSVRIVLSTTWVRVLDFRRARKRLGCLRSRVIGATFHSRYMDPEVFKETPRYQQILQDVHRRRPHRWLAVDDATEDWPGSLQSHLFPTLSEQGLWAPSVREAFVSRLRDQFG